jgi:hypothetical protein
MVAVLATVIPSGLTAGAAGTPSPATGPNVAAAPAATSPSPAVLSVSAYWAVARDGGIFSFGGVPFYGSAGSIRLNQPVVGMAATSPTDFGGYREVASDGGIFDYGNARFFGSTGGTQLNQPIVGMAASPSGNGYWLVAADGGIFAYGDAAFHGSTGAIHLNQPVVGMAATPSGNGYWLVAKDGGIFAYGDAAFHGSTGAIHLNRPIVGMAATHDGGGYWFTGADGGVFAYGDAGFYGSLGNLPQSHPLVSLTVDRSGQGYWFINSNGAVSAFGDATYWGSAPQVINQAVVGMAQATGNGRFTGSSYPSGSFGYDISLYQCPSRGGTLPPAPHTIGIVQVEASGFPVNPCLAQQAAWAGGGLNLYVYVNYGTAATSGDPACNASADPSSCNYGYAAAIRAFTDAQGAGVNTQVAWWLDVENPSAWSPHTSYNAALVQGAIDALRYEGINSVGIYASPGNWPQIVGNYRPAVPYWAADWGIDPATTCSNIRSIWPGLPTGPVQIVQFSSPSAPLPLGGMSLAYDDNYAC